MSRCVYCNSGESILMDDGACYAEEECRERMRRRIDKLRNALHARLNPVCIGEKCCEDCRAIRAALADDAAEEAAVDG